MVDFPEFKVPELDFSGLAKIPLMYEAGKKAGQESKLTNALSKIPLGPNGEPDIRAMYDTIVKYGSPDQALSAVEKLTPTTQFQTVTHPYGGQGLVGITTSPGTPPQIVPYNMPGQSEGESDIKTISEGIISGKQPPDLTGLGRSGRAAAVRAELQRQGFDLTSAQLEWKEANKQVSSLNSQRMIQYTGLAGSVLNTIGEVKARAQDLKLSGIGPLNQAQLAVLTKTAGNTEQGQAATRYLTSINTLKEEFANLANGGYAPTEAAWTLANQQINGNYGVDQIGASLDEVERLINYRLNAIPGLKTLGPGAENRYSGATPAETKSRGVGNAPPPGKIPTANDMGELRKFANNPAFRKEFEGHYGPGSVDYWLGAGEWKQQ